MIDPSEAVNYRKKVNFYNRFNSDQANMLQKWRELGDRRTQELNEGKWLEESAFE